MDCICHGWKRKATCVLCFVFVWRMAKAEGIRQSVLLAFVLSGLRTYLCIVLYCIVLAHPMGGYSVPLSSVIEAKQLDDATATLMMQYAIEITQRERGYLHPTHKGRIVLFW